MYRQAYSKMIVFGKHLHILTIILKLPESTLAIQATLYTNLNIKINIKLKHSLKNIQFSLYWLHSDLLHFCQIQMLPLRLRVGHQS